MTTVFVAGIHGVGKSTCCAAAAEVLNFRHITASQVIREAKSSAIAREGKLVANVDENQALLISGLTYLRESNGRILLDGHMTLQTSGGVVAISVTAFRELAVDALVVLLDSPEEVRKRLELRDARPADVKAIRAHQASEVAHAEEVARALRIPVEYIDGADPAALIQAVRRITNSR